MVISRERKILIGVAGLAFALFALDRLFAGGVTQPAKANAAVAAPVAQTASPVTVAPVANTLSDPMAAFAPAGPSLAQRLESIGQDLPERTHDAFSTPEAWRPKGEPVATPTGNHFDPQLFARKHPVDAVFASNGETQAVVNSEVVRVGEMRDGMLLQNIGDRWVDWIGNGVRVRVHVRNN